MTPSAADSPFDPFARDRLVLVAEQTADRPLAAELRRRYADWRVHTCDTYLSGIVEVSRRPPRGVVAWVAPGTRRLDGAIAGLRQAAGPRTRIVLCCPPSAEPLARSVLPDGADDYVLFPIDGTDLDRALGVARYEPSLEPPMAIPIDPAVELEQLASALIVPADDPRDMVEQLARLIRTALGARGVMVVVEGSTITVGEGVVQPVLSAPIPGSTGHVGRVIVGDREKPYGSHDMHRLTQYATIAGHVLARAARERSWRRLAFTDECSGLPNRRYLYDRLDDVLRRAAAERFAVTVLLFDVDNFKRYNDAYGHAAGDEIIRVIGQLFRQHCREQDVVTRYGGDEFAVVFWDPEGARVAGSAHPGCALNVLDRFKDALKTHPFAALGPSAQGTLTISGGLATYPWDGASRAELLRRADEALLAAKRAGKNRIIVIGSETP